MRLLIGIVATVSLMACGEKHKPKPAKPNGGSATLAEMFEQKMERARWEFDPATHWPSATDCDGTLWAGLAKAAGVDLDLTLARRDDGSYGRRPSPPCWTSESGDQGSKTTFSNDQAQGLMWGLWRSGDRDAADAWAGYLEDRNFVMGEPWPAESRLYMLLNGQGLMGRILYALSRGRIDKSYRHAFEYYFPVSGDSEMHVQALGIVLQGEVEESLRLNSLDATVKPRGEDTDQEAVALVDIKDHMLGRLQALVNASPNDALFHASLGVYTGNFDRAIELLLDPGYQPPSYVRGDRPEAYALTHWLFAARLVLRRYPEGK